MGRLFWKFFFSFLIVLIMVGAGVGATIWVQQQEREGPFKDIVGGYRTAYTIQLVVDILRYNDSQPYVRSIFKLFEHDPLVPEIYIVDQHRKELFNRQVPSVAFDHAVQLINMGFKPEIVRKVVLKNGHEYILFAPKVGELSSEHYQFYPVSSPFTMPIFFGMLASIACSAFLAWYFTRSVRYLRWALNSVSEGHLNIRVHSLMCKQRDEIADLGQHFDRMIQKIEQLIASQQRLLHDVSHEIRSPLARMQVAIGLLRQQPHLLESQLSRLELEVKRFDELVDELLTLSRLENGMHEHSEEYFDLIALIEAVVENARFEAKSKQQSITSHAQGEILLRGCAKLLYRAVENVIRNAIKYTPLHSSIEVTLTRTLHNKILITISDSGPGIPEKDLETVFQPFVRGLLEKERSGGYGLGLSIARRAVEAHGGIITAKNKKEGGLSVMIELPILIKK